MKKSELNQFIKEEVLKAMAEAVDTGAFRRLVITSPKHKLIQSGAEKYLTQNAHMYPDLTFKVMPSPKPNTFVIDLVGNKATVVGIKLQDLAERLDKTAIVLVRKEKKLGVKESIINEGSMSDINLMAQEAKDFNSFVKEFMKEYSDAPGDETELKDWLQSIYDDAKLNSEAVAEKIKVGDTVGNTVQGFDFEVLSISGDHMKVKNKVTGKTIDTYIDNMSLPTVKESVITEGTTKTILGVKFKMAPAPGNGIKFEFVDSKQFIKSGVSANEMVEEIQKMLDDKFGKDLFWFKPAGRMQYDTKVNGFEFRMNANQFFKDL